MERIIVYPDELYHYGRLGMKWGQSIYGSKKSGSSGKASTKSLSSIKGRFSKAAAAITGSKPKPPKKKSIKDMTDKEINDRRTRAEAEYNLIMAEQKLAQVTRTPEQAFVQAALKNVIAPAAVVVGKELTTKYMRKYGTKTLSGL